MRVNVISSAADIKCYALHIVEAGSTDVCRVAAKTPRPADATDCDGLPQNEPAPGRRCAHCLARNNCANLKQYGRRAHELNIVSLGHEVR
jgi:hypothetical protein